MPAGSIPCGISIPQVFVDGKVNMPFRDYLVKTETLGYDSLWAQEKIIGNFAMLEPVSLLTYAAAITSTSKLDDSTSSIAPILQLLTRPLFYTKLKAGKCLIYIGREGWPELDEALFVDGMIKTESLRKTG